MQEEVAQARQARAELAKLQALRKQVRLEPREHSAVLTLSALLGRLL